jgi:hypothetical protein
LPIEIPDA